MKVIDLIIKLQNLPPNHEVMLDFTPDNSNMFKFASIETADEFDIDDSGNLVVILSPFDYGDLPEN